MSPITQLITYLTEAPECRDMEISRPLRLSGVIACLIGIVGPLLLGLISNWSSLLLVAYLLVGISYFLLTILAMGYWQPDRFANSLWLYLLLSGVFGFVLQALSGDPFLQPIIFTVPVVIATLAYNPARVTIIGLFYLGVMVAGLILSGMDDARGIILPLSAYSSLMFFMYVFTRMSRDQAEARRRADQLANDVRQERDRLATLLAENRRLAEQAALSATLAERNRLARELHDTIAQGIMAVIMQLEAAQRSFERDPARSRTRLTRAQELTRATLDDVRRSVWTLAEPLIDSAELPTALQQLAHQSQERSGLQTQFVQHGITPTLNTGAASQLLRIAQEALHNVEKHAAAERVTITLEQAPGQVRLRIQDDGIGFDPQHAPSSNGHGFGLTSLHERARLAGGTLAITSQPGHGSRVEVMIGESETEA